MPRIELPIADDDGRMSREWYKFFAQVSSAIGPSLTTTDDLQTVENLDGAMSEGLAIRAIQTALTATGMFLLAGDAVKTPPDNTLLALWPSDAK